MWSKVPNNVVKWGKSQESVRKAESQLCEERRPRHWIRWNWEFICKVYFRDLDSAKTFSPTSKDLEPGNGRSTPLIGNSRIPRNERTEQQFTENKDAILHKHHPIISCTLNTAPQRIKYYSPRPFHDVWSSGRDVELCARWGHRRGRRRSPGGRAGVRRRHRVGSLSSARGRDSLCVAPLYVNLRRQYAQWSSMIGCLFLSPEIHLHQR